MSAATPHQPVRQAHAAARTSPGASSAAWTCAALAVAGLLLIAQGACLPPIPNVGRACDTTDECRSGPFALLSGSLYCVDTDAGAADGGARGICLLLQQAPNDAGAPDAGDPVDAGDGDGDDAGHDAGVITDPGDRQDPYACETFAPFVRGMVVALEDGPVVRQPLSAFDLPAPASAWSVTNTTRLGDAEVIGADLVFAPGVDAVGQGQLELTNNLGTGAPCADRVVAVTVMLIDSREWTELVPEDPEGCTASACGKVLLTEDYPNLLAGRTYEGVAVVSGVSEVSIVDADDDDTIAIETLSWLGAPVTFNHIRALTLGDAAIGAALRVEGRAPALDIGEGQVLDVAGWLRTDGFTIGAPGGAADAALHVGAVAWVQSDGPIVTAGPHTVTVRGALAGTAGATWSDTDLLVEGALVVGGPWRCASGTVSFGETGQVWVEGDGALACPGVPLPDVWVFPAGHLRVGTALGFTSFAAGAQLHTRGQLDICRWEQLEAGDAPPPIVLDDGAELVVGTPLTQDQHDALLAGCTITDGANVSTRPVGACGDPDVTFPVVDRHGTRGVIVSCVGADACPPTARLAQAELIGAPPAPYRPEIAEVAGGELRAQGFDLVFTPGFVGQRSTARVMSCTGPTFGVDIEALAIPPTAWFWRSDAESDELGDPDNWLDDEGKPADNPPASSADALLFVLPGDVGPRVGAAFSAGDLRVMGGAEMHLDAPLTLTNTALVSGRVVADQNAGEVVLTSLGVLPPDGQVAGHLARVAITDGSTPQLSGALRADQLSVRSPDGDGLTLFVEEDARLIIDDTLVLDGPDLSLQLVGPADGAPTLSINGTFDLGEADLFGMFNGTVIEVSGGVICDDGFPSTAVFSGNEQLRFVGSALQPLACKSPVGAVPPQVEIAKGARVQLDGQKDASIGVTRVGEGVSLTTTIHVNGELLFFGPDLSPQQLVGVDEIIVGSQGRLRFPPGDPGVDLLSGASCTAASGVFTAAQIEGFDAWCDP